MKKINPICIECVCDHEMKETTLWSVIVNGKFKNVVFLKLDGACYILIGDNDRYKEMCGLDGFTATVHPEWFEVSKEEGNALYKKIAATKKLSKKGTAYYRW